MHGKPESVDTRGNQDDTHEAETSQFHSGSLCSVCSICEHCSDRCGKCPCEEGDMSDHCGQCQECSTCYLCPILCDTVCTPGGFVDEMTGSIFQTVASFL
ncbi:uncharacterized protein KZ484_011453 isoform 2-T2 [Pholidichthys leucotaenia]